MVHQKRFKPLDALNVEVVGGLVQQEEIWLHEQQLGQLHTHFPTATEFGHLPGHVGDLEAKALKDAMGLFLRAGGPNGIKPFVGVAQLLNEVGVAVAFVVGPFGHFLGQCFKPGL